MAMPCESHWKATKKFFQYLKGTLNFDIMYIDEYDDELVGYSDLDWVGNPKKINLCICIQYKTNDHIMEQQK